MTTNLFSGGSDLESRTMRPDLLSLCYLMVEHMFEKHDPTGEADLPLFWEIRRDTYVILARGLARAQELFVPRWDAKGPPTLLGYPIRFTKAIPRGNLRLCPPDKIQA